MRSRLRAVVLASSVLLIGWLCGYASPAIAMGIGKGQESGARHGRAASGRRRKQPQSPSPQQAQGPAAEPGQPNPFGQAQAPSPDHGQEPLAGHVQTPSADQALPKVPVDPDRFAVIISGVGGEEAYTRKFTGQAMQLDQILTTRFGFVENNVIVLTESGAPGPENPPLEADKLGAPPSTLARSDAGEVRKAFARIKQHCRPETLVLVILIGHGSFDSQVAKFNLVGPDLAAKDYAALVGSLASKHVVFINCSSASGEFIKPMSGDGRVIITATRSGNEQNITTFADSMIAALRDPAADTDRNGRLSVLEVFNYTSNKIAEYYKQKNLLATEHALIDDNGDGVGHEAGAAGDGAIAALTFLDPRPAALAGADPELSRLLDQRQSLEGEIGKLKSRKADMKPEEYDAELERLLVELAKVNQSIKARGK